jgi:hypothetical protein
MDFLQKLLQDPEIMGIVVAILVYVGKTIWDRFGAVRTSKASALARKIFWELEDGKTSYEGGEDKEQAFDYLFDKGWQSLTGKKPSDSLKTTAFETVQELNTELKKDKHTGTPKKTTRKK